MNAAASDLVAALCEQSDSATDGGDDELQMPMRDLFDVARAHRNLPLPELEAIFDHDAELVRLAGVCVLDFKARAVKTREERRPLREMYLHRHDRIDTWGMVDRAAPWVVGGSLDGHDLSVLHELASSPRPIERRSAITAPLYFVKFGDDDEVDRSFAIAHELADDPETVVHKAVGIFIKHAGRRLPERQRAFLERHAATRPSRPPHGHQATRPLDSPVIPRSLTPRAAGARAASAAMTTSMTTPATTADAAAA